MQIHELSTFDGTPTATDFLVIDDGSETTKVPATLVGTDTTYPAMTESEAQTGTRTASRVISPKVLHDFVVGLCTVTPLTTSWSAVPATLGQANTVGHLTLAANRKYIVIASNANGLAAPQANNVNFTCSGASTLLIGAGLNNTGNGNACTGWAYVETGSSSRTLNITSYGYVSTAMFTGNAIAIPLGV